MSNIPIQSDKVRAAQERERRRAEALRDNLHRRKAQARDRANDAASPEGGMPKGNGTDDAPADPSA